MSKAISVRSRKTVLCNTPPPRGRLTVGLVLIKSLMRQQERQNVGVKRRENASLRVRKSPDFARVAQETNSFD
jgi:hypothetical protein